MGEDRDYLEGFMTFQEWYMEKQEGVYDLLEGYVVLQEGQTT